MNDYNKELKDIAAIDNYKCSHFYLTTSQPSKYFLTHLLLLFGMVFYYIFVSNYSTTALIVLTIISHVASLLFLLVLGIKDPGILVKNFKKYQYYQCRQIPVRPDLQTGEIKFKDLEYIFQIKGYCLRLKFCRTCLNFKPPRSYHCPQCNVCIQKFDHHCPWIGNCIGRQNYIYYLLFLSSIVFLTVLILIQNVSQFMIWDMMRLQSQIINIFLFIYCFLALAFSCALLCFHIYLISKGSTTYEYLRLAWSPLSGNPNEKRSCLKNFLKIFIHSIPKSNPNLEMHRRRIRQDTLKSINIQTQQIQINIDNTTL